MKNTLVKLGILASIVAIGFLVFQPIEQKQHTEQEMQNMSKAFSKKIAQIQQSNTPPTTTKPVSKETDPKSNQQSIIGVIYKKPGTTWFFKAKDSQERINSISARLKNYFVDQLRFDENHQPILTHIPDSMKAANTSSMRVATYMLAGVEISVSQLSGQQDVFANVKRWMRQIGLTENSPIQLDFKDDKKTILVKMPK